MNLEQFLEVFFVHLLLADFGIGCWIQWARYLLDAVGSSRILIGNQKIGLTFNSDKLGGNDFTKFSKLTMCDDEK